jgi:hypothetical protein
MRLRLLTFAGAVALALAVPSAALAHHGHHHSRHHHAARAHHAKFHFERIGPAGVSAQTTTPSAPTTPTTPTTTNENAGKVTSYEKEVLTITLNDNTTTASGKVTADTRIVCVPATTTPTTTEPGDKSPGDDSGEGDDQSRGDMSQSGGGWGDDQGDQGDDDGSGGPATAPEPPCDTSLLVSGTLVRAGELRLGPSGAEWEFLVLVR